MSLTILLSLLLFQLYYITAWKSQERRRREETVAAPLTSYQRGETQWLRSQQPHASCFSYSFSFPSRTSSRFPPPSRFLSLFLCQLVLSRLAQFSLACSTVPSLSLSPPSSLILLFSVRCLFFFGFNIESLPALWKLPLSPSYGTSGGSKKKKT